MKCILDSGEGQRSNASVLLALSSSKLTSSPGHKLGSLLHANCAVSAVSLSRQVLAVSRSYWCPAHPPAAASNARFTTSVSHT